MYAVNITSSPLCRSQGSSSLTDYDSLELQPFQSCSDDDDEMPYMYFVIAYSESRFSRSASEAVPVARS